MYGQLDFRYDSLVIPPRYDAGIRTSPLIPMHPFRDNHG